MAQTSPSPFTSGYRHDANHRLTGTISPDPDGSGSLGFPAVRNSYDAAGRLVKVEKGELSSWQSEAVAPANWTGFTVQQIVDTSYDAFDRKIRETVTAGGTAHAVVQYSYDAVGRMQCVAVRMDPAQWNSQTDACVPQTSGPNGPDRVTKNVYDAAGQLVQVRKAVGTPLEQAYATYSYTTSGKQEYVIDAGGNRAKKEYDGFDRQVKWIFPSATKPAAYNPSTQVNALATAGALNTSDYEQYGYDVNDSRTSFRKRDGQVISYSYDALRRMTLKDLPSGSDVYYGYDLRGAQTYARFGSAAAEGVTNVWDGLGRLTSSTNNMGGTSRTLGYQYDGDGNRTRLTFPDGQYFTYEYDGIDRMTSIRENGGTEIASFSYNGRGERTGVGGGFNTSFSYDGIGRLAGITHDMAGTGLDVTFCMGTLSGATCTPAYNPASQVLNRTVSNSAYVWNGHANVNRGYTANGLNQYTAAGSASFAYDLRGNLTSDGSTTYAYDVENRLLSATGATNATLSWDPMGRLYQTTGSATTRFLYDGDELVGEYDASGNLLRRYVHGPGNDDPLVWYEGSDLTDRRHLRADHQGSIVAIGNSAGNSIGLNSYDEYGIPGTGNIGRFAYTGQIRIPELGMYHYKARIYSPTLGRFLQTDPIGYDDQINLYAYVGNDPLNLADPTGLEKNCVATSGPGHCWDNNIEVEGKKLQPTPISSTTAGGGVDTGPVINLSSLSRGNGPKNLSDDLPDADPIDFGCMKAAAKKNAVALGLDAAGALIPGASTASTLGKLAVGGAAMVNSAVTANRSQPGGFIASVSLGVADFHITSATPLVSQFENVSNIARAVPFVGNLVSLTAAGLDVYNAYEDYKNCVAGKK